MSYICHFFLAFNKETLNCNFSPEKFVRGLNVERHLLILSDSHLKETEHLMLQKQKQDQKLFLWPRGFPTNTTLKSTDLVRG